MSKTSRIVIALIANGLFLLFIFGLAHSISTGFAGFWGGVTVLDHKSVRYNFCSVRCF